MCECFSLLTAEKNQVNKASIRMIYNRGNATP